MIKKALPSEFEDPLAYSIYCELREEYGLDEPNEPQNLDIIYPLPSNPQTLIADALIASQFRRF